MRKSISSVLAAAATATALAGGATSASAAVTDSDPWGCPSGYVCIFAQDGVTIAEKYYTYGAHNLSGMFGSHFVDNNQTGGATASLCYGYNGVNCTGGTIEAGAVYLKDLTPINSIRLNRP